MGLRKALYPNLVALRNASSLRCPECDARMQLFSCANVVIDKCPSCQGIWFDTRELGVFRDTLQAHDLGDLKVRSPESDSTPSLLACPRDGTVLTAFTYSYNSKVRLQRCDRCHGIWAPFTEILHLIEYAKLSQAITPHLREMSRELAEHHAAIERWRAIGAAGDFLNQPVRPWWTWDSSLPWWRQPAAYRPIGIILPLGTSELAMREVYGTYAILLANLGVFVAAGANSVALAMAPAELFAGGHWLAPLTSFFAHAGFWHLFGNLFFFWLFGTAVETRIGTARFLGLYLGVGLATNLVYAFTHASSAIPLLGASGAVSSVLGAYLFFFPSATVRTLVIQAVIDVPAWLYLGSWFALQAFFALLAAGADRPGIAYSAHVTGFLFGFLVALGMQLREPIRREA